MRNYPDDFDCVWIASDRDGHLGAFVTAGVGPIPVAVLRSQTVAIEDIEAAIHELPNACDTRLLIDARGADSFVAMSDRGFFVYDWQDIHRTFRESSHLYEPVAIPVKPITMSDLREPLLSLAAAVTLGASSFSEERPIDLFAELPCRPGNRLTLISGGSER